MASEITLSARSPKIMADDGRKMVLGKSPTTVLVLVQVTDARKRESMQNLERETTDNEVLSVINLHEKLNYSVVRPYSAAPMNFRNILQPFFKNTITS